MIRYYTEIRRNLDHSAYISLRERLRTLPQSGQLAAVHSRTLLEQLVFAPAGGETAAFAVCNEQREGRSFFLQKQDGFGDSVSLTQYPLIGRQYDLLLKGEYAFLSRLDHALPRELHFRLLVQSVRPRPAQRMRREVADFTQSGVRILLDTPLGGSQAFRGKRPQPHHTLTVLYVTYIPATISDILGIGAAGGNMLSRYAAYSIASV